eukprot:5608648-Prymnesium_polylepis.1
MWPDGLIVCVGGGKPGRADASPSATWVQGGDRAVLLLRETPTPPSPAVRRKCVRDTTSRRLGEAPCEAHVLGPDACDCVEDCVCRGFLHFGIFHDRVALRGLRAPARPCRLPCRLAVGVASSLASAERSARAAAAPTPVVRGPRRPALSPAVGSSRANLRTFHRVALPITAPVRWENRKSQLLVRAEGARNFEALELLSARHFGLFLARFWCEYAPVS